MVLYLNDAPRTWTQNLPELPISNSKPFSLATNASLDFNDAKMPLAPIPKEKVENLSHHDFQKPAAKTNFFRLDSGIVNTTDDVRSIFPNYAGDDKELVLFVLPHDDDGIIGAGYTLVNLLKAKVPVAIVVATDGSAGYGSERERSSISRIRLSEFSDSARILGLNVNDGLSTKGRLLRSIAQKVLPLAAKILPNMQTELLFKFAYENSSMVRFLNLPDDRTTAVLGKQFEEPLVRVFRQGFLVDGTYRQPSRILYPTGNDTHIDHQNVAKEVPISVFHAMSQIWKDTAGSKSLAKMPQLIECIVYCKFEGAGKPDILVHGCQKDQETIVAGLNAYQSQLPNIPSMVERVRNFPYEFLRFANPPLFSSKERADYLEAFKALTPSV